ncbi:hypothetical protein [Laceyella putida]|uniref:Uncharacterized protein n=1 Tax=Laceyella putida TaxID=110101 RepID=A0ABW2RGX3_9BACL
MSQYESQYDMIIIGTDPSDQEAVRKLQESGKSAYYIQLTPKMITTLVSQALTKAETSEPSSATEDFDKGHKLTLQQSTLHTPAGETTTYAIHVAKSEVDTDEELAFTGETTYYEPAPYQTHQLDDEPDSAEEELEVLEAQEVEYASPYSFFQEAPVTSTRKKGLRRKSRMPFQPEQEQQEDYSVYSVERISLEDDDHESEQEPINHSPWGEPSSISQLFSHLGTEPQPVQQTSNKLDEEEPAQPIYRERDQKLRKRLSASQRIHYAENPVKHEENGQQQTTLFPFESHASMHHSPFYRESSSPYQESASYQDSTQGIQFEADEPNAQPLEPFAPRRRNRQQKKARFHQKIESLAEKRASKANKQNSSSFWEEQPLTSNHQSPFFAFEDGPLFENTQPSIQPFSRDLYQDGELDDGDASLKRDDIEFEDAYGGYNSWEEFLTPHSQNSRKRQEMDKIEKRKLALRGLHSLINNLG